VDEHRKFPLKCFLIILMQDDRLIPACRQLLHDDFLAKTFAVDGKLVENIVIYLYRKRLSLNPVYEENKLYIDAIVKILEEANVKRRFLELSEIYAGMFSSHSYKMKYPFFKSYYPTVDEVAAVIAELAREDLLQLDHEEVFDLIIEFKALGEDVENIVDTRRNRFANHSGEEKLRVMKHELYTVFFLSFMRHGLIKERALAIAADIMDMDTRYKIYNIIVPVFLIEIAQLELIAQIADPLSRLVSYYFNFQDELQAFVNGLFADQDGFTNQ
jgi:tetrahydromethanopterin S-methyltransferase subunit B